MQLSAVMQLSWISYLDKTVLLCLFLHVVYWLITICSIDKTIFTRKNVYLILVLFCMLQNKIILTSIYHSEHNGGKRIHINEFAQMFDACLF